MIQTTLNAALINLLEAKRYSTIEDEALLRLEHPLMTVEVDLPLRKDDGSLSIFTGYRVRYNDTLGPAKGGIRFHPEVTLEEIKVLALYMTIKCAAVGIPFGGAKGAIIVNPKTLSHLELERLSRTFIERIHPFIGPNSDIPAPDVYTNARIMGWMMDEYSKIVGRYSPDAITGKPIELGGSLGRELATGRGAYFCVKELEKQKGYKRSNIRVALQGFGNVGQAVAQFLHNDNYKIVALSDSEGGIYSEEGFHIPSVIKGKLETKRLHGVYCEGALCEFVDAEKITNEELLELDVDLLIPAALENQITKKNAEKVKAPVILELANGPITKEADDILNGKGVLIVPDVIANSGGVTVSYFEWVQNRMGLYWSEEEIDTRLKAIMVKEFNAIYQSMVEKNISMRKAVYAHALNRLGRAIAATGTHKFFGKE